MRLAASCISVFRLMFLQQHYFVYISEPVMLSQHVQFASHPLSDEINYRCKKF